jgi:hypothetical protein
MTTAYRPTRSTRSRTGRSFITGKPVAENDKERVRQRIARALFHEYGISVDDMEPDFKVKVDGSNKKIDIAIFERSSEHTPENVRRLVVCQKVRVPVIVIGHSGRR